MIKTKRFIALYIDFLISFIFIYFPVLISDNVFENIIVVRVIITIISLCSFVWLMIHKDLLFKNASIGKKLMGLKIYNNNEIPEKNIIIKRNELTFLIFPLYIFLILFKNKSYGDLKYNTEVK